MAKRPQKLVALVDGETLTEADFLKAFNGVIEHIKKIDERNAKEFVAITKTIEELATKLKNTNSEDIKDIKTNVESRLNKAISECYGIMKSMQTEHQVGMNYLYDKVTKLEDGLDGEPGEPGKDANPEVVANLVTSQLWPLWEEELKKLREEIAQRRLGGGGGTSAIGVQFALGKLIKHETPTGDIDGVNVTYTVTQDIHAVITFGINGMVLHDNEFSISGRTITMTTAIPAALSGTRFRISYI